MAISLLSCCISAKVGVSGAVIAFDLSLVHYGSGQVLIAARLNKNSRLFATEDWLRETDICRLL